MTMFIPMLFVTFLVSLAACFGVVMLFYRPVTSILHRLIGEALSAAWKRYIAFAIFVVGISGGVRIWELEKYITPRTVGGEPILLNADRWTLEVYRTFIETLQSVAWMLLVFFVVALVAFVILRGFELARAGKTAEQKGIGNGQAQPVPTNGADTPAAR
jgi:hypothetical protein